MELRIVQTNLNRSWRAQNLLGQFAAEERMNVCIVSGPTSVMTGWFGLAMIDWLGRDISCQLVRRGEKTVAVRVGGNVLMSCYCSPNLPVTEFLSMLDEIQLTVSDAYWLMVHQD